MNPRRFVSATTFSISCSPGIVKAAVPASRLLFVTPLSPTLSPEGRGDSASLARPIFPRLFARQSAFFQYGQYVARWVLEPRYVWALFCGDASRNAFFVGHVAVVLELDAFAIQLINRFLDIVNREVEDRVCRRLVVGLAVDPDAVSTGNLYSYAQSIFFYLKPKRLTVERLCRGQIVD